MNKKNILLLVIITMMVITMFGCAQVKDKDQGAQEDQMVTAMISADLNPEMGDPITSGSDFCIYEAMYEPLVKYGENGEIEACLAEKWDISEDGKTYTFYLKKDILFSDGTEFNADNVLLNAKRWDPESFSAKLKDVKKVDDYTVSMEFEENSYTTLIELTFPRPYRMASENAFDKDGNFVEMIGTGQWMSESYVPEQEVILVPNPNYRGDAPNIDKLVFKKVTDSEAQIMAMQSGEADISLSDPIAESVTIVKKDDNLDIMEKNGSMGYFLMLNEKNPILQDTKVRQAINYAVDKESIANNLYNGNALAATGLLPETVPYVTKENSPGYAYNIDKAKTLLKEAGYTDTDGDTILEKNGEKLKLRLVFQTEEFPAWKGLSEYLQSELAKIGIEVELQLRESSAYYDAIWDSRDFDMIIYRTYTDSWNPHGFMRSMFYIPEGSPAIAWSDDVLIQDIVDVFKIQDEKKRSEKYDKIFKELNDNALTVPLCYPQKQYMYNKNLDNLVLAPTAYEAIEWQEVIKN